MRNNAKCWGFGGNHTKDRRFICGTYTRNQYEDFSYNAQRLNRLKNHVYFSSWHSLEECFNYNKNQSP
jgi:hypothetical protein